MSRVPRFVASASLVLVMGLGADASPAEAQSSRRESSGVVATPRALEPRVDVELPPPSSNTTAGPLVWGADILAEPEMRDLLRNGFPARMHFKVELWSAGGWFDDLEGTTEWDVIVRYDPLGQDYRVVRITGQRVQTVGRFRQYADAVAAAEQPFRAPIRAPRNRQRHYYNVLLDVEVLSLNDLDEVERWLRGELRPAVRGERNPATAVGRGVRTLMTRLLGGESRRYSRRTPTFRGGE